MSNVSQNEIYETVCDDLFSYPCKIASLVDLRGKVTFWMSTYVSLLYGVSAVFQNFRVLGIRKDCKTKLQNEKCKIYPNFAFCCKIKLQNYLHRCVCIIFCECYICSRHILWTHNAWNIYIDRCLDNNSNLWLFCKVCMN